MVNIKDDDKVSAHHSFSYLFPVYKLSVLDEESFKKLGSIYFFFSTFSDIFCSFLYELDYLCDNALVANISSRYVAY